MVEIGSKSKKIIDESYILDNVFRRSRFSSTYSIKNNLSLGDNISNDFDFFNK